MLGMRMTRGRRAIVASIFALGAVTLVSSVVAGQFRSTDPKSFHDALANGEVVRVADIAAADGSPGRGVFVQTTDRGHFCLFDALSALSPQRQGGCNSVDDPLGDSALLVSLAYDGGPVVEDARDARLIGLAVSRVAAVEVLMNDGTRRGVRLKLTRLGSDEYVAFGYRVKNADLRKGIGPTAVIAKDAAGTELARQATGIGS
jgi:hypothetical protein